MKKKMTASVKLVAAIIGQIALIKFRPDMFPNVAPSG